MPKLYTQEEVDKLLAEKLASVRTKDLTDYEIEKAIGLLNGYDAFRAVIAADRENNRA